MNPQPARATDIVVLSVLYPPGVGGSAVLLENVYSRVSRYSVAVVTDAEKSPGEDGPQNGVQVYRRHFFTRRWGVLGLGALKDHFRTHRALRSAPFHARTL